MLSALLAFVMSYALSYLSVKAGYGIVSGGKEFSPRGPEALMLAGLNLYAVQHVLLVGDGKVDAAFGPPQDVSAGISLPTTVWILLPAISLLVAGYIAARLRRGCGRWSSLGPALLAGTIYAVLIAAFSSLWTARISWFVLPEIAGLSSNPPQVAFHAYWLSSLGHGLVCGLVFCYVGGLIEIRFRRGYKNTGKWWVCAKAAILASLMIQVVIAISLVGWYEIYGAPSDRTNGQQSRLLEMLPSAMAATYVLTNGVSLVGFVESSVGTSVQRPFFVEVNLYRGLRDKSKPEKSKGIPPIAYVLTGLTCVVLVWAGWAAVAWGSRDGSLPTAIRITLVHTCYLVVIAAFCSLVMITREGRDVSTSAGIALRYDPLALAGVAGVFVLTWIGAQMRGLRGRYISA